MEITPALLLHAYRHGLFPMAHPEVGNSIFWYAPDPRAVLPIDSFRIPKNLTKLVLRKPFEVVTDRDFEGVVRGCAERVSTWISEEIITIYTQLHQMGYAHSVECWKDGRLAGGLYGVAIRGAFFGESMFFRIRDASKVAFVHLVRRLKEGGYVLLDTQYATEHLKRFGVVEIPKVEYECRLEDALRVDATWI